MATKNHFRTYKTLRDGFVKQRGDRVGTVPGAPPPGVGDLKSKLPPYWVDMVNETEKIVKDVEQRMIKLHDAHKSRLMVRFDDDADTARDEEIDELTNGITKRLQEAHALVKLIGTKDGRAEVGGEEEAVRLNIQKSVASKLQSLSMEFRKSQKQYMSRLKMQKSGKSGIFIDEEEEATDFAINKNKNRNDGLSDAEMLAMETQKINIRERDQEIQKIAENIEELATLFRELSVLVIDQGTILDRIDYNMDTVVAHVEAGNKELLETVKIQKQARPQKCIAILVLVIFILLIILAYKHSG